MLGEIEELDDQAFQTTFSSEPKDTQNFSNLNGRAPLFIILDILISKGQ